MKLQHAFEVPSSPDTTMALLLDAERVVPCMPGATLVEVVDDATWKAEMAVKLGPVAMRFQVDVRLLERDDADHHVRLGLSGRDARGKGGAEGEVASRIAGTDAGGSRVEMQTDLRLSGQVAQLGRPGVVQDVSNKLVGQFAECIRAQLSASQEEAAVAAPPPQHKPVSGLSLAIAALVSSIKRLLGRGGGRAKGESA